jgi:DNA-binding XRE family transcriptional regulator
LPRGVIFRWRDGLGAGSIANTREVIDVRELPKYDRWPNGYGARPDLGYWNRKKVPNVEYVFDGEWLKLCRKSLRMPAHMIAHAGGISDSTLFRYEAGEMVPSVTVAAAIAAYLEIPLGDLLRRQERKQTLSPEQMAAIAESGQGRSR